MREQEVRDQHGLRRAKVCIRRHQRLAGRAGLARERPDNRRDRLLKGGNAAPEIEPEIERHLLVARPPGVQPLPRVTEFGDEQALDEAVYVLVGTVHERGIRAALRENVDSADWMDAASSAVRTPAPASARAHARLPVTSSSNSRRSKLNDDPHSKAAASGA